MTGFPSFADFYQAVHGFEPFPWQIGLSDRVVDGDWPTNIDVPTGLGKTSVLDIAVHRLARELATGVTPRRAHTRIAFVVDRRLIVDAAHGHIASLTQALKDGATPVTRAVADALMSMSGAAPLTAQRMRGGLSWSSRWVRSPAQPMVLLGTVDQIGSRLLFRGYGTSHRMAPIDAGLLGSDTLLLLDEAHLSQAFAETAASLAARQSRSDRDPHPERPLTIVEMTATPSWGSETLISDADLDHEAAATRLTAAKNTQLVDVPSAKSPSKSVDHIGDVLTMLARDAIETHSLPGPVVLVVANTVNAARRAFDTLQQASVDAALVVGRARGIDRARQLDSWFRRVSAGRDRSDSQTPFVVVATQTIEVGVDIDADVLVTEVAPIDSLIQRFGRVDRLGHLGESTSYVVRVPSRLKGDPPPYGAASESTWDWLDGFVYETAEATPKKMVQPTDASFDFGTMTIRDRLDESGDVDSLRAPTSRPPVVIAPVIECWRRTAPVPEPDEHVAPYLHGVGRGAESVTLLWRCDLPDAAGVAEPFELRPPVRSHETVELSMSMARAFLAGVAHADRTDVEAVTPEHQRVPDQVGAGALVRRADGWVPLSSPRDLRPGDVVAVPTSFGGHDEWAFTGSSTDARVVPVTDVADLPVDEHDVGQVALRLDRRVLAGYLGRSLNEAESDLLDAAISVDLLPADRRDHARALVAELLAGLDPADGYGRPLQLLLRALADTAVSALRIEGVADIDGADDRRIVAQLRGPGTVASDVSDEDDVSTSINPMARVTLDAHLRSVGERGQEFAERVGLRAELVTAIELAGRFHDLGKADPRFQATLRGGPQWLAEAHGPEASDLLAKSCDIGRHDRSAVRRESAWPPGYRHEAVSLALVQQAELGVFQGVDRELVEHLVAAHHGHARPLFPARLDECPVDVDVVFDGVSFTGSSNGSHPGWSHPARFDRLCERYGEWGLAHLEAVLRLADISISEEGR